MNQWNVLGMDPEDKKENDLEMECPRCQNRGRFRIPVTVGRIVTPEGNLDDPMAADEEYDEDSPCECVYCQHSATVLDFQLAAKSRKERHERTTNPL